MGAMDIGRSGGVVMNDPTTTRPSSVHSDMQSLYEREAKWMAAIAGNGGEISRAIGRATREIEGRDAAPKVSRAIDRGVNT